MTLEASKHRSGLMTLRFTLIALILPLAAGCGTVKLTMTKEREPKFVASVNPGLASKRFRKLVVVPPAGTADASFKTEMGILSSSFREVGIDLIRGRVVGKTSIENGLEVAKKMGGDGLLLVTRYGWAPTRPITRFFILDDSKEKKVFREMKAKDFKNWKGTKIGFRASSLYFNGVLVDVMSGKTMASVQAEAPSNWSLPEDYVAEFNADGMPTSETFDYGKRSRVRGTGAFVFEPDATGWVPEARKRTVKNVLSLVARKITEHLE
jgi:hypothetical protein